MANFTGGAQWADTAVLLISSPNKALLLFSSGPPAPSLIGDSALGRRGRSRGPIEVQPAP